MQTYLHPDRQWVFDPGSNNDPRVFYYRYLDRRAKGDGGPAGVRAGSCDFRVRKHISAEKARWEPALRHLDFRERLEPRDPGGRREQFKNFSGQATTFKEIYERPDYFLQEVLQDQQMNSSNWRPTFATCSGAASTPLRCR